MNRQNNWRICAQYSDELYHWGIFGQKWGIRRYQNEDGTLTAAGKERYGSGSRSDRNYSYNEYGEPRENKLKRAGESVKDFFLTTDEETGKTKMSNKGKAVLIGAGATTAAVLAAVGIGGLVKKAGGAKYLTSFTAKAMRDVKTMDNANLLKFTKYHRNEAFNIAIGRKKDGSTASGRNIQQLVKSTIATTVANREYSKRTTEHILRKLVNAPVDFNAYATSQKGEQFVGGILSSSASKTATGLLAVGSAALTGSLAFKIKEMADEQDPTGTKAKYVAPNPNQKKK